MERSRPHASLDELRILVVDDNAINREFLLAGLRRLAREVSVAGDGLEAIERSAGEAFDVIVLDLHMPRVDGLTAAKRIRELDSPSSEARLIVLTADSRPEERTRVLAAGVDDYLTKPIAIADLAAAISALFGAGQARPDSSRQGSVPMLLIDRERALAAANNDPELADRLSAMLVAELDERLGPLDDWLAERRFDRAAGQLHQWAGAAGFAGALRFAEACRALRGSLLSDPEPAPGRAYLKFLRIAHATRAALAADS